MQSLRKVPIRVSGQEGFTLIELLIASVLILVVMGAVFGIWLGLQRTYTFADEDMKAQSEARAALNEMVEFVRTAREPGSYVGSDMNLAIVRAEPNALVLWTDVDRDAAHDLELVRFRVDTGTRSLYRDDCQTADGTFASSTSTRLVGSWVSNDTAPEDWLFTYMGVNGTALDMEESATDPLHVVDPTRIREVRIVLKVDVVMGESPQYHELASTVQPRNLRTY
jgi:prepilin-type N-terminal cleavage/methylation domain-containing protein